MSRLGYARDRSHRARPSLDRAETARRSSQRDPGCLIGSVSGPKSAANAMMPTAYAATTKVLCLLLAAARTSGTPVALQNACATVGAHALPVRNTRNDANAPNSDVYANCADTASSARAVARRSARRDPPRAKTKTFVLRRDHLLARLGKWWTCAGRRAAAPG